MKLITYIYKGIWLCGFRMMNIWNTVRLWMRLSGSGVDYHFDVRAYGGCPQIRVSPKAHCVSIGHNVVLNNSNDAGWYAQSAVWVKSGATLHIGNNTGLNGALVYAAESIFIGDNVCIGGGTRIMDTDFHPLDYISRRVGIDGTLTAPIRIEDDVFIGAGVIIMKGVTIGKHSVIGAGAVVTKSVPENEVWVGNPAHFIRKVDSCDFRSR